jgi:hypothetical protein
MPVCLAILFRAKPKAEADNTNWGLNNSSYIGLRVNACIVNKNTQVTKPFVFSRFWHKQHKLVWRHKVIYVFSVYDQITSYCRICVFNIQWWCHNSKFGQLPNGYDDFIHNPVQKFLENAFFRSFSAICELFFPPSPISMLKIVIFVLHKVVLSR